MNSVSSAQSWFFQQSSQVLFVNDYTKRVGIKQPNPQYALDVNGDISCSNIVAINAVIQDKLESDTIVSASNFTLFLQTSNALIDDTLISNKVISGSNLTDYIEADFGVVNDVHCSTLTAYSNIQCHSNVVIGSNLAILNTYLNSPCPFPGEANYFGFSDEGWIHSSWIHTDPSMMELLGKLWDIGAAGWDIFDAVKDVYTYFNPASTGGGLADQMQQDLSDALNDGETDSNNKVYVDWQNLNNRPLYANKTTKQIGLNGDIYLDESKSLYSINSSYLTNGTRNNLTLLSTSNAEKLVDIGTKQAYLNGLSIGTSISMSNNSNIPIRLHNFTLTSNAIINSNNFIRFTPCNIEVVGLNTSNFACCNMSANVIQVGNFTVTNDGIWVNYSNPLLSQKVIDNNGLYLSSITKEQITNLEGFRLTQMADGVVQWGAYDSGVSSYTDPFAFNGEPLFIVS